MSAASAEAFSAQHGQGCVLVPVTWMVAAGLG